MNYSHRSSQLILTISLISSTILSSCENAKFAQCEQILLVANNTVNITLNIVQSEQKKSSEQLELSVWLKAADSLEQGSKDMQNLQISDATLKDYQGKLVTLYHQQAEATYGMIKARQDRDLKGAMEAQNLAAIAGKSETEIGTGLNNYCKPENK